MLASSAKPDEVGHYVDLLVVRDLVNGWTTWGDVEKTKPHPDLIIAAMKKAGGFSRQELEEARAAAVFESIAELRRDLDSTPLG